MDLLQLREREVFEVLKKIKAAEFVIIGGYAVNAYTLPRFSVDCDIVVLDKSESDKIQKTLRALGYKRKELIQTASFVNFERYEKDLANNFKVNFDILIREVMDRQTNVSIHADWIFKNSEVMTLKGKTITEKLDVRILTIDALFVMKMISCRSTDIRDLFMLAPSIKDKKFVKQEVSSRYDFNDRFKKVKEKITSKKFRDGLQGVYGLIDTQIFEKNVQAILALNDEQ